MVHAVFHQDVQKGVITANISGHAQAVTDGTDTVCASVSILALGLAQAVQFQYDNGYLKREPLIKLDGGEALIIATPKMESYGEVLHSFWDYEVGFHLLATKCPDYVQLVSFGSSEKSE